MEESKKNNNGVERGGDKEILYSKAIRAGKRIYYLDVKKSSKDDLFVAITESKRVQETSKSPVTFEKHKIFLYSEDFKRFMNVLKQVMDYADAYKANIVNPRVSSNLKNVEETEDLRLDSSDLASLEQELE